MLIYRVYLYVCGSIMRALGLLTFKMGYAFFSLFPLIILASYAIAVLVTRFLRMNILLIINLFILFEYFSHHLKSKQKKIRIIFHKTNCLLTILSKKFIAKCNYLNINRLKLAWNPRFRPATKTLCAKFCHVFLLGIPGNLDKDLLQKHASVYLHRALDKWNKLDNTLLLSLSKTYRVLVLNSKNQTNKSSILKIKSFSDFRFKISKYQSFDRIAGFVGGNRKISVYEFQRDQIKSLKFRNIHPLGNLKKLTLRNLMQSAHKKKSEKWKIIEFELAPCLKKNRRGELYQKTMEFFRGRQFLSTV
ncbi:hypothetical protein BpHYR1_001495 [Brachionus plicatilis]|uniref:Uncharacterized protein n=1 Tax=Brachionus plicatilis TaxID=10195 RepID=A0A3M7QDA8_BRAPC|nr:hypothetical protein BpHYR1_001495 [Brachionus plicatilis]